MIFEMAFLATVRDVGLPIRDLFYIPDISAITIYTSQKNSHVTLACDVKLSKRQLNRPYTIKWIASGGSFQTVIEKLSNKDVVIGISFTGRVELVNGTSLKINRLQLRDSRDYQCRVTLYNRRYDDGPWNRLKVNDDPIPSTTRPTNKPVSTKRRTTTPTTATRVATPLSVTPYTVRDGDGGDGGDDTESDGSGGLTLNTDVSVDESKGISSVDAVTDPRTTTILDTESQSLKESTEISTVKSTYDKTKTLSDKTSVEKKHYYDRKTTIPRNETRSPSVDVIGTRISTETTAESVTITEAAGLFFNVTITERKTNVIKLQVRVSSTKEEKFTILKWLYKTENNSTRTEEKAVRRAHYIDESIKVKGLEIGFCYNFQIDVQTQNGRWIGPIDQRACTKPRSPGSGTRIGNTTITSIPLLIEHPYDGHFDSFRIDYENNANKFSMTVSRAVGVNQTKTEITGLVPQSCYTIDVYAVSFSESSHNSRSFTNVCTQTPLDPNYYTVIYGESSFTIFWVNFSDKYHVNVSCNSWTKMVSSNKPSLSVNRTVPGDCCVLNVKNLNDTVSRQYSVHVNETLPEYPVVISNVTTRTHLDLTWREPIRSNGWIHRYTVHLFDSEDTTIEHYIVVCIQPKPKCSRNDSYWKYQCSSFSLANNRNGNIYYNNSHFYLSIRGLKPGMLYRYSVTAMNKAGLNTTDRIPVITQEDSKIFSNL
ncbi:unnamed protein product [Mytilus edulis]|uniref:Uncharacterized protein n=1 Tax=Mytilus edulis TaxID=6550 RepID=A0A8S3TCJ2_MYTED|nr:unnamed protein product [Mytilus edulis]